MNPSYLHGAYCCYDEDDRTLKIVFMSEELNILHLSSKKIDLPPSFTFTFHTHIHTNLLFLLIFIYHPVNWLKQRPQRVWHLSVKLQVSTS